MDKLKYNLSSNDVNVTPADSNEDMNNELQQFNIMGILKKSVKNSSAALVKDNLITSMKKKIISTTKEYKYIRKWTKVNQGIAFFLNFDISHLTLKVAAPKIDLR